jgi:hypothetical protein
VRSGGLKGRKAEAAGAAGFVEDRAMKRGESEVEKSADAMTLGMG